MRHDMHGSGNLPCRIDTSHIMCATSRIVFLLHLLRFLEFRT